MQLKDLTNKIIYGDCLEKLKLIPNDSIDLVYLDPPFFSNRTYEIIWGNGAEMEAFGDRWKGGIHVYIDWMEERVREIHRVLKPTGSIYLHCDKHANHYLRVMLDKIFGEKNFRNEIIWGYRTGGVSKKYFPQKHDNIYWYSKSNKWTYHPIKERIYYEKPFFNEQKDEKGRYYADVYIRDVWDDPLKPVINVSKERIGYPTQKPECLLERIILASSNEGDIILDPFLGGGTTIAVADRLKRNWIGMDVSHRACATSYKRVVQKQQFKLGDVDSFIYDKEMLMNIMDFPATEETVCKLPPRPDFEDWCHGMLGTIPNPKRSGDGGRDGWFRDGTPLEIKQSSMSRPHIQKLHSVIITEGKDKGVIVGRSIPSTVWEKISELKRDHNITIIPLRIQQLIDGDFEELNKLKIPHSKRHKTIDEIYDL